MADTESKYTQPEYWGGHSPNDNCQRPSSRLLPWRQAESEEDYSRDIIRSLTQVPQDGVTYEIRQRLPRNRLQRGQVIGASYELLDLPIRRILGAPSYREGDLLGVVIDGSLAYMVRRNIVQTNLERDLGPLAGLVGRFFNIPEVGGGVDHQKKRTKDIFSRVRSITVYKR
jgi:hypothetical protein